MPKRAAESQSDSEVHTSGHFQPREDDDETLHEVIEITGETKSRYKVRWKGNDPETKKPWPQSWVPKRDCTDDLVLTWKTEKKKKKDRRKSKKHGRNSTTSKLISRSVASTGRTNTRSESFATSSKRRSERSRSAGPSNVKSKSKSNLHFEEVAVKEEDEFESTIERDLLLGQRQHASVSFEGSNVRHNSPPSDVPPKGTKRKRKPQSADSSANQTSSRRIEAVSVEVDSDEGRTTRKEAVVVSKPPKKKRRITSDSEEPPPQQLLTHHEEKKSHDGRLQPVVGTDDGVESEEERMMEDALSDGYHSADRSRNDDFKMDPRNGNLDGGKQETKDKPKETLHLRQEEEEEEEEEESEGMEEMEVPKKANIIRRRQEEDEESEGVEILKAPGQPRLPIRSNVARVVPASPSKRPSARMMPQLPRSLSSNKHKRRPVVPERVPKLGSKALNKTKKSRDSPFVAQSSGNKNPRESRPPLFERDSDSDRSPLPEWHQRPKQYEPDVISIHDSDDSDGDVILSPRARQRLALFDAEVMGKKMPVVEQKRVGNDNGDVSTLKRSSSSGNSRPQTSTVRPTARFGGQSYNMDVVPETELENSQEDKLQASSIAVNGHEKRNDVAPIASSTVGPSVTKSLRPIPHISPSTFHSHLQPPNSSLPDTIIEPSSSLEQQLEIEAIEQFESPEKERVLHTKAIVILNKNGVVLEARKENRSGATANQRGPEEVWDSEIVRRGQENAEQAEAKNRRVSASSGAKSSTKKSLQEVVACAESLSRSEGNASRPDEDDDDKQQCEEEGVANASTSVVPPASGPPALSQDQPPPVDDAFHPIDDDLVDLNDGEPGEVEKTYEDVDETSAGINPEVLRQEEEENTQDIMAELQERADGIKEISSNEGQNLGSPPAYAPTPGLVNGGTGGPNILVSVGEPKLASRSTSSRPLRKGNQVDAEPRGPVTRSRSRSKTPSGKNNARGMKKPLSIPSPVPSRRESAEPEPEVPKFLVDVFQNVQGTSTAPSVFPAQISSLQIQVQEKQLEIDSLRERLRSSEDREALLEADKQKQMTDLHSQWVNEKSAWENERTTLAAQTAASEQSKVQAEQDREFIREQYANASAYVTTVREENRELEQRVKIAEEQSTKGVELIKTTFQLQVAKLQDDAKAWRKMAEFTIQKDIQTNDDIRKRAAEEPELRMLCVRQKRSLHEARAKIDGLRVDLQETSSLRDASTAELEHCKKENARLHSDLNEALIKLDRIGRSGDESTQGDDHEFVYRCMWRVEADNTQSVCPEVFMTMRELEQHLYLGHLASH